MESFSCHPTPGFSSPSQSSFPIKPSSASTFFIPTKLPKLNCAKQGGPQKSTFKDERMNAIELEQVPNIEGKLSEKCKEEPGGIVELLECLEREALMGEDVGTHPNDYHRRALIFDHSSKIFQTHHIKNPPPL